MARLSKSEIPPVRLHKGSGQAYVSINGQWQYLGKHGSDAAKAKYDRIIAEWLVNGRCIPVAPDEITITELVNLFRQHAEEHYRQPDGKPSSSLRNYQMVTRELREVYGYLAAAEFGPLKLRALREHFIGKDWSRGVINANIRLIRHIFRWAASRELIPIDSHTRLCAVEPLERGRTRARETDPVKPVPIEHVEAVLPLVSHQVAAMIRLQLFTGARCGELIGLRPIDLDMSGDVWTYTPTVHKTTYRGHSRTIYLGPKAQEVIRPLFAGRPVDQPIFSAIEADQERRRRQHEQRITPASCGNNVGTNRKRNPATKPGSRYDLASYRRAIARACVKAGVPHWHPHQLRHNAATELRKQFGLESARIILGHKSALITEIYAEQDHSKALEVMKRIG